jgi:uncharacterized SAM-binding protein YcdF (DUF218 family)
MDAGPTMTANKQVCIMILGKSLVGNKPTAELVARVEKASELGKAQAKLIDNNGMCTFPLFLASGGLTGGNTVTEASVMKALLLGHSVHEKLIKEEGSSTTTKENMSFCKPLLDPRFIKKVILVTSDYHVERAKLLFQSIIGEVFDFKLQICSVPWLGGIPTDMRIKILKKEANLISQLQHEYLNTANTKIKALSPLAFPPGSLISAPPTVSPVGAPPGTTTSAPVSGQPTKFPFAIAVQHTVHTSHSKAKRAKVNDKGEYMPYPGTSVISFLCREDALLLQPFYEFIKTQKMFMAHYALLPISSYHMTIKNLSVAGNASCANWFENQFVPNFQKYWEMRMVCANSNQHEISAKIESTYFRGTFGLAMRPTLEPIRVLQERLVHLGAKPEPDFKFHMTMAYQFKHVSEADKKTLNDEAKQISAALQQLVTSRGFVLRFGLPTLCYFKDMTSFVPL